MLNLKNKTQNLCFVPEIQELSILDSVIEEISDVNSASITGGARENFRGTISGGYATLPTRYITTSEFNDISIRLTYNPYDLYVKAVRADSPGDVSSYSRFIPANSHDVVTVAADVRDGTPFRLYFSSPTTRNPFNIEGRITY